MEGVAEGADPHLTDRGRTQVARLVDWLASERLEAVYASPMRRAVETATPLADAHQLPVEVDIEIAEFDRAADSYIPIEELRAEKDERWYALIEGRWHEDGTGEHPEVFVPRVVAAVERIVARHTGGRVAIVCHGGVINAYLASILGIDKLLWFEPAYASIHRVAAARTGQRSVVSINERPGRPPEWAELGVIR